MNDLMTLTEVAQYLHFSNESGALRWLKREDVLMFRRGKRWLIPRAGVDRALERQAVGDSEARARSMQRRGHVSA